MACHTASSAARTPSLAVRNSPLYLWACSSSSTSSSSTAALPPPPSPRPNPLPSPPPLSAQYSALQFHQAAAHSLTWPTTPPAFSSSSALPPSFHPAPLIAYASLPSYASSSFFPPPHQPPCTSVDEPSPFLFSPSFTTSLPPIHHDTGRTTYHVPVEVHDDDKEAEDWEAYLRANVEMGEGEFDGDMSEWEEEGTMDVEEQE
ncbi:hypothetical protein JCM8547_001909 [Rhodosporidiobolus lusitaniae]